MIKNDYYRYIAIFTYSDDGISITFPNLPGCVSFGKDEDEAIKNAKEVLLLHIFGMEEDGDEIPQASSIKDIILGKEEYTVLIEIYICHLSEKHNN